jgi:hypothetical protein
MQNAITALQQQPKTVEIKMGIKRAKVGTSTTVEIKILW